MLKRNDLIVSDASPIIALLAIGEIDLLRQLYDRVLITDVVRNDIHTQIPTWITVSAAYDLQQYKLLCLELDAGEASAIAFTLENPGCRIILDERKGRAIAKRLHLQVIGLLGIIIKAKEVRLITSVKTVLDKLDVHGFWISETLREAVLKRVGEDLR